MASHKEKLIKRTNDLLSEGKLNGAVKLLQDDSDKRKRDIDALVILSELYVRYAGRPAMAAQTISRAVDRAPRNREVLEEAIRANIAAKNFVAASKAAENLLKLKHLKAESYVLAARAMKEVEEHEKEFECLEAALKLEPSNIQALVFKADALRILGRFDEAIAIVKPLIEERPTRTNALSTYIETQKLEPDDTIIHHLEFETVPRLRESEDAQTRRLLPNYLRLLAKAKNDAGEYKQAFQLYDESRKEQGIEIDRLQFPTFIDHMKRGVTRTDFFGHTGSDDNRPVLIVGMPRVGSTLLEQVLGAHTKVQGVGEITTMPEIRTANGAKRHDGPALLRLLERSDAEIKELAKEYSDDITHRAPDAERVVDKNLYNFENLPLIARMFPKAKVIHALRDPLDNCVGIYLRNLNPRGHSYINNLSALGQFYREHRVLMDYWKQVLPLDIMEVSYENMVADTEGMARKVIDFIGLDWEPGCLNFQDNAKEVRTASVWQVRQPVYKTSVKRWKRYEEFLDPLKKELKVFYPNGFEEPAV